MGFCIEYTMKVQHHKIVIIGAGIAGAALAHRLGLLGYTPLVIDKRGIAKGASGAAGAFVSPKIGKGSTLQQLTNQAFDIAKDFYRRYTPEHFFQSGIIRIPKNNEDAQKFAAYAAHNIANYRTLTPQALHEMGIKAVFESFFFPEAGVCEASDVCHRLMQETPLLSEEVYSLQQEAETWKLTTATRTLTATHVVLCTGYEDRLADLSYMGIRGTWGTRADFATKRSIPYTMHQSISISATHNGIVKVGATHEKQITTPIPCDETQAQRLKTKAADLVDSDDFQLVRSYCGMRSGSRDFFPLVGKVIDVEYMLQTYPKIVRGAVAPLRHLKGLYILGGLGGRGFVFAPLMAKWLSALMLEETPVPDTVNPDRLFWKWARKLEIRN